MSIKNVVKVMNFHSLLRVDSAKKNAEKYLNLGNVIENLIDNILNNRNLIHDKRILLPNPDRPELDIFIGSDFGFCGDYNAQIKRVMRNKELFERNSHKIIIGRKLKPAEASNPNVILVMNKEEALNQSDKLQDFIVNSVKNYEHSRINIIYNHYYNVSNISVKDKTIYPLKLEGKDPSSYREDFVIEGDVNALLANLIACYVSYEVKITLANSNASENIFRQNTTKESIHRIEEMEQVAERIARKEMRSKAFKKQTENYLHQRKR